MCRVAQRFQSGFPTGFRLQSLAMKRVGIAAACFFSAAVRVLPKRPPQRHRDTEVAQRKATR